MLQNLSEAIAFVKRFHHDFPVSPQLAADRIPANIPPPLALLYRELGGWLEDVDTPGPLSTQNAIYRPRDLVWDGDFVEFATENQNNWYCRCLAAAEDPPVLSDATEYWSNEIEGFNEVSPRLSEFLITFLLTEALFACGTIETHDSVDLELLNLVPLWLNGRHAYEHGFDFYCTVDELILFMKSDEWYLGSTEAVAAA